MNSCSLKNRPGTLFSTSLGCADRLVVSIHQHAKDGHFPDPKFYVFIFFDMF